MTPEQIEQFRQQAKSQLGFSDSQVDSYLASKGVKSAPILTSSPTAKQDNRNILQKTAGFLGVEKAGQGIASTVRNTTGQNKQITGQNDAAGQRQRQLIDAARKLPVGSPERTRLLKQAQSQVSNTQTQADIDSGLNLSNREVIGSFANVGLNAVTPGAFKGSKAAVIAKNAALGAGYGASGGLNDNKNLKGIAGATVLGGAMGAALPIAGVAAGKVKETVTKALPERLYNTAVKPTLDELRKNIKYGADTLGKELISEGVKGSPENLLKVAQTKMDALESSLQTTLRESKSVISRDEIAPYLKSLSERFAETPGLAGEGETLKAILSQLPDQMSLSRANQIKRNIYTEIRNVGYKLDANLSTKREAMKAVASGLKQEIEKKAGSQVRDINKRLSIYGRLEDRVVDVLARGNRNNLLSLTDAVLAGGGLAAGSPLGFAAALGRQAAGSSWVKTNAAVGLSKLGKVGTGKTARAVKGAAKRVILNAN